MRLGGLNITFKRGREEAQAPPMRGMPNSRPGWQSSVLSAFSSVPDATQYGVIRLLRDNIPAIDAAIQTYCALVGTLEVTADEPLKTDIETFLRGVKVGHFGRGFKRFQDQMITSKLLFGKGVAEVVPNNAGSDIYALTVIDPETIGLRPVEGAPLELTVFQRQATAEVDLDPLLTLISTHGGDIDPHGVSLLRSVPFIGKILLLIEEATQVSWERYGCPVYHVHIPLPAEFSDPSGTKTRAMMDDVQANWNEALRARKSGAVRDFFTASTEGASIQVIGAGQAVLDLQAPYRTFAEQVCSATHLPPWMLGFTWSTTERLSTNQADLLVSLVRGVTEEWMPHAKRVIQLWMDMTGRSGDYEVLPAPMSLQDAAETARAEVMAAQAVSIREKNARELWKCGVWTQEQYAEGVLLEDWDGEIAVEMDSPPSAPSPFGGEDIAGSDPAEPQSADDAGEVAEPSDESESREEGSEPPSTTDAEGEEAEEEDEEEDEEGDGSRKKRKPKPKPKFAADSRTSIGSGRDHSDKRVRRAIAGMRADINEAFGEFSAATWRAFDLPKPGTFADALEPDGPPFKFTAAQMRRFNKAADRFVERMMGHDLTKAGFISAEAGDGIVQQWSRFGHAIGVSRAAELVGTPAPGVVPDRNSDAIQKLLSDSFDKLSDDGQLRIGSQLDGIRDVIREGMESGANPVVVAGDLSEKFSGYQDYEWERLARTEVAFAQNRGMEDEFKADGFATDDLSERPPFHPNCMCGLTIDTKRNRVVYDIATQACELCQAYVMEGAD